MDNGFATIPLFEVLREKGIGACGTTRVNGPKYPLFLKSNDDLVEWNTMDGCVVSSTALGSGVLCFRWMDNNVVRILSTIHPWNETTLTTRRKPRTTSSNATMVRRVFRDQERMPCYIPSVIDDYNHHMNGVDLADQRRATYTTHQRARRNWLAFLYFFLDMSIINAHLLFTMARNKQLNQLLDSHALQSSDLLSSPLAQFYSTELFRHTLFHQLSLYNTPNPGPNKPKEANPPNRSPISHLGGSQKRYRLPKYYKPRSSRILFTRYSDLRKPWVQVKPCSSSSSQTASESNSTTTFSTDSHTLAQIPNQKRRECAVCRYFFRTGQTHGRRRPKLTCYQCLLCVPPIALCGPDIHSECFIYWHRTMNRA